MRALQKFDFMVDIVLQIREKHLIFFNGKSLRYILSCGDLTKKTHMDVVQRRVYCLLSFMGRRLISLKLRNIGR